MLHALSSMIGVGAQKPPGFLINIQRRSPRSSCGYYLHPHQFETISMSKKVKIYVLYLSPPLKWQRQYQLPYLVRKSIYWKMGPKATEQSGQCCGIHQSHNHSRPSDICNGARLGHEIYPSSAWFSKWSIDPCLGVRCDTGLLMKMANSVLPCYAYQIH